MEWLKKNDLSILVLTGMVIVAVALTGCQSLKEEEEESHNPTSPGETTDALIGNPVIVFTYSELGEGSGSPSPEPTPASTPLPSGVILSESLKDFQTTGNYTDGAFTAEGLQFRGIYWHLRYSIPTTPNGYLEFTAKGFVQDEYHRDAKYQEHGEFKSYLVTMWSGVDGYDHDTASFIYEIRKYGLISGRPDASNSIVFTITSNRVFRDNFYFRLGWDRNTAYRFRVEWSNGETRLYRDGALIATCPYQAPFAPTDHQIQIGANLLNPKPNRRKEGPADLLISDVVIGRL